MLSKIYSAQLTGLHTDFIEVEVDISKGLHSFSIVGLGDKAVTEAKDRISAAIKNSGFKSPQKGNKKVIISLAPANIKKEGTIFDLAIAVATLIAQKELDFDFNKKLLLGELGLDGELRPIKGALLIAREAVSRGFEEIYLPADNAREASLIHELKIFPVKNLVQIVEHFSKQSKIRKISPQPKTAIDQTTKNITIDFADVVGQHLAKRGLEIAAAGGHNVAMYGPPGTGKTMLARALTGILPPLSFTEILEATGIHSARGTIEDGELIIAPPFRSPHHTSSHISLVGGGANPAPGEITLAHRGVLFLDEFPEFERRTIEALRQPLEDRIVSVSRARGSMIFPANFILVATMNPCPCGHRGSRTHECICSSAQLFKYQRRVSGPIIDRIDLWLEVGSVPMKDLAGKSSGENSEAIRERVTKARELQRQRYTDLNKVSQNSDLNTRELKKFAPLNDTVQTLLDRSAEALGLSARAYHRVIKIARTIADLDGADNIADKHLLEALQYRPKNIFS